MWVLASSILGPRLTRVLFAESKNDRRVKKWRPRFELKLGPPASCSLFKGLTLLFMLLERDSDVMLET
jgi:hypothetical protein